MIFNPLFISGANSVNELGKSKFANPNFLFTDIINVKGNNSEFGLNETQPSFSSMLGVTQTSKNYLVSSSAAQSNNENALKGYKLGENEIAGVISELIKNSDNVEICNDEKVYYTNNNPEGSVFEILQKVMGSLEKGENVKLNLKTGNSSYSVELQGVNQNDISYNAFQGFESAKAIPNKETIVEIDESKYNTKSKNSNKLSLKDLAELINDPRIFNEVQKSLPVKTVEQLKKIMSGNSDSARLENYFVENPTTAEMVKHAAVSNKPVLFEALKNIVKSSSEHNLNPEVLNKLDSIVKYVLEDKVERLPVLAKVLNKVNGTESGKDSKQLGSLAHKLNDLFDNSSDVKNITSEILAELKDKSLQPLFGFYQDVAVTNPGNVKPNDVLIAEVNDLLDDDTLRLSQIFPELKSCISALDKEDVVKELLSDPAIAGIVEARITSLLSKVNIDSDSPDVKLSTSEAAGLKKELLAAFTANDKDFAVKIDEIVIKYNLNDIKNLNLSGESESLKPVFTDVLKRLSANNSKSAGVFKNLLQNNQQAVLNESELQEIKKELIKSFTLNDADFKAKVKEIVSNYNLDSHEIQKQLAQSSDLKPIIEAVETKLGNSGDITARVIRSIAHDAGSVPLNDNKVAELEKELIKSFKLNDKAFAAKLKELTAEYKIDEPVNQKILAKSDSLKPALEAVISRLKGSDKSTSEIFEKIAANNASESTVKNQPNVNSTLENFLKIVAAKSMPAESGSKVSETVKQDKESANQEFLLKITNSEADKKGINELTKLITKEDASANDEDKKVTKLIERNIGKTKAVASADNKSNVSDIHKNLSKTDEPVNNKQAQSEQRVRPEVRGVVDIKQIENFSKPLNMKRGLGEYNYNEKPEVNEKLSADNQQPKNDKAEVFAKSSNLNTGDKPLNDSIKQPEVQPVKHQKESAETVEINKTSERTVIKNTEQTSAAGAIDKTVQKSDANANQKHEYANADSEKTAKISGEQNEESENKFGNQKENESHKSMHSSVNHSDKNTHSISKTFESHLQNTGNVRESIQKRINVIKDVELSRVNNEIRNIAASRTSQNVTLKLNPLTLGEVKVAIEVIENSVKASIEVENEAARTVVNSGMEQLKQTLVQQGLQPGSINVALSNPDDKHQKFTKNSKKKNSSSTEVETENSVEKDAPKNMGYNTYDYVA